MLSFSGSTVSFNSPIAIKVTYANTDTGDSVSMSIDANPPEATTAMFHGLFRKMIWQDIHKRGWPQSKVRIESVELIHEDATGDDDEQMFCNEIWGHLKHTYSA